MICIYDALVQIQLLVQARKIGNMDAAYEFQKNLDTYR